MDREWSRLRRKDTFRHTRLRLGLIGELVEVWGVVTLTIVVNFILLKLGSSAELC